MVTSGRPLTKKCRYHRHGAIKAVMKEDIQTQVRVIREDMQAKILINQKDLGKKINIKNVSLEI